MIKRKGWRGPIKNINLIKSKIGKILIKNNLEKKIGWEIARIIKVDDSKIEIETENNKKGEINLSSIDWIKNSKMEKNFKVGDIDIC